MIYASKRWRQVGTLTSRQICIFERSNEKNNFSKTKIYFHKKTTPQLLGHIGLQIMKIRVKAKFGRLAAVCLMLTVALKNSFPQEAARGN